MNNAIRTRRVIGVMLLTLGAAAGTAMGADSGDETLAEITVTAQKREQNLQEVGTSISVLTANDIAERGLNDLTSVVQQTVGFELIQFSPAVTNLSIRGVSQASYSDHLEAPIAVYVDDAYVSANGAVAGALFDIERIEVLRGPQGTLFGRNATGGLVHYISRRPTKTFEGHVGLTAARFGERTIEGALSGPIAGNLLGRLSFAVNHGDGDMTDTTGPTTPKQKNYALRGQLAAPFGDSADGWLSLHYSRNDHEKVDTYWSYAAITDSNGLGRPVAPNEDAYGTCPGCDFLGYSYPSQSSFRRSTDGPHDFNRTIAGATFKLNATFAGMNLTAISDGYYMDKAYAEDSDATPNALANTITNQHLKQFSQEVRLDGEHGAARWVGGLYYMSLNSTNMAAFPIPLFGLDNVVRYDQTVRTGAAFAQIEYALAEKWSLIAGARYSLDRKSVSATWTDDVLNQTFLVYNPSTDRAARRSFSGMSGKLEVDYKPVDGVMVYASINRGYKGGNWNIPIFPVDTALLPHEAEKLTSYEVGAKSTLADGRLRLNGSAFYYDYKDYQAFTIRSFVASIFNVPATMKGVELEATAAPVRGLTLQLGYAGLWSRVDDLSFPNGAPAPDRKMPAAPQTSFTALVRYEWPAIGGKLALQGDGKYTSTQYYSTYNGPADLSPSRFVGNVRASYAYEGTHYSWDITAFVRNVTNKVYGVYGVDVSALGFNQMTLAPPRVYGASVSVRF